MGVGVFARLQHTPGIRQWDPRAENWVPICASIWDQNPRLGPAADGSDIKVIVFIKITMILGVKQFTPVRRFGPDNVP